MGVSFINFLKHNHRKKITLQVYLYSAIYRFCVKFVPAKKLERRMGIRGEESEPEETVENLRYAGMVGMHVNRVTTHTPWESLCLVRALTAKKLLSKKKIPCTLYLGVGKDKEKNDKMIAHAWLRCGQMYVTGGNGEGYAMVAKFRSM